VRLLTTTTLASGLLSTSMAVLNHSQPSHNCHFVLVCLSTQRSLRRICGGYPAIISGAHVRPKQSQKKGKQDTYAPVPPLPERSHAHVEADAKEKCTRKDGADENTW